MKRSPRRFSETALQSGIRGGNGDGGNRTHDKVPPCETVTVERETADGHQVLLDAHDAWLLENPRWTWRLAPSGNRSHLRYVLRHTTLSGPTGERHARIYLHREILGLSADDPRYVDHVDGDPLDNRRANLRIATTAENAQNQGSRGGSSRYRGVTWDKSRQKWMATAMLDGRRVTIGRYDDEDVAGAEAAAWRAEHMPFSAEAQAAA